MDLSESRAKVARADEHIQALDEEVQAILDQRKPYTARLKFDQRSGCGSLFIVSREFYEPRLGVILGDVIHNLRSALDYIITGLVTKSGARLGPRHQFPIFDDANEYIAGSGRMLSGVRYGLSEIESVQPYHRDPSPKYDSLFVINFFSNADKHRAITQYFPVLVDVLGQIGPQFGMVLLKKLAPPEQWAPNQEHEVLRYRYAINPASEPTFEGDISVSIHLAADAFGKHAKGIAFPIEYVQAISKRVSEIVAIFEAL